MYLAENYKKEFKTVQFLQSWDTINIFCEFYALAPFSQVYFQIFCTARIYASFAWTLQYLANKYTAHMCKLKKVFIKKKGQILCMILQRGLYFMSRLRTYLSSQTICFDLQTLAQAGQ